MSFTIGIGVLLEANANNKLRHLELLLVNETGNWSGLGQPPHVTVKVPFQVSTAQDVERASRIMADLASGTTSFDIELQDFGNFGDKVIYAAVKNPDKLLRLSNKLIDEFIAPGAAREYERKRMIFHSTLAMNLSESQYLAGTEILRETSLEIKTKVTGLGLFMGINNLQHWVVISESPFRSN